MTSTTDTIVRVSSVDELLAALTPHHFVGIEYAPVRDTIHPFVLDSRALHSHAVVPAILDGMPQASAMGYVAAHDADPHRWSAQYTRRAPFAVPANSAKSISYSLRGRNPHVYTQNCSAHAYAQRHPFALRPLLVGTTEFFVRGSQFHGSVEMQRAFDGETLDVTPVMREHLVRVFYGNLASEFLRIDTSR